MDHGNTQPLFNAYRDPYMARLLSLLPTAAVPAPSDSPRPRHCKHG